MSVYFKNLQALSHATEIILSGLYVLFVWCKKVKISPFVEKCKLQTTK